MNGCNWFYATSSRVSYEEIESRSWSETDTAPNGSSSRTVWWTIVTLRARYTDAPENGYLAGTSQEIRDLWHGLHEGHRNTRIDSSTSPWTRD